MTPDELREWGDSLGYGVVYTKERLKEVLYSAADAWQDCEERWLKNVEVDSVVIADLRLRLEVAEKNIEMLAKAYGMVRWKIPHTNWDVMNAAQELYQAALAGRPAQQVAEADRAYVPYKCDCVICQMLSKLFGPAA